MKRKTLLPAFIALFAAVICVGCFIMIPLGPVPIVLQNALCILTAVLLGGLFAGAPVALFLLAGLIGLPVYSGGSSGIGVWMGPTGGFLLGYLLGAIVSGLLAGKPSVTDKKITLGLALRVSLAMIAGMVILYIPGVIHFAKWAVGGGRVPAEKSVMAYTMAACVIPYIPGDIIKLVITIPVALKIRPVIAQYLYAD